MFDIIFDNGFIPDERLEVGVGFIKPIYIYKQRWPSTTWKLCTHNTIKLPWQTIGKRLICILCNRLENYTSEISLVNENQCGLRKQRPKDQFIQKCSTDIIIQLYNALSNKDNYPKTSNTIKTKNSKYIEKT